MTIYLKQILLGAFLAASTAAVQFPGTVATELQQAPAAKPVVDNSPAAKAKRGAARRVADDLAWSALRATRREPKAALKGISLSSGEKRATWFIAEKFLDASEELDKTHQNSYRASSYVSTLMADIATLRLKQRAELRAALSPDKRVRYDENVALLMTKEAAG
jgi:hypothetical protein